MNVFTSASFRRIYHSPTWVRIVVTTSIAIAWLAVGGIGGPTFGKLSSVSTNDQAAFLPASAQSTQVQDIQSKFRSSNSIPAIVVFESTETIPRSSYSGYTTIAQKLTKVPGVQQGTAAQPITVAGPIPSDDGKAVQLIVPISDTGTTKTVVASLRDTARANTPAGQKAYVTGPAGLAADLIKAFGGIDGILLLVALGVVFTILLLVYRSIALPFIVLLNSVFALCGSILLVYTMAKWGWIELNGQSQGILSILVIGAATDYSLLLVARYNEALKHTPSRWRAIAQGMKRSSEPIAASAATVIVALLCLLFSDLNSNRSLGPIAASGIALSLIATLTFLPAMLALFGRASFWPKRPGYAPDTAATAASTNSDITPLWRRTGQLVAAHPRLVWISSVILLLIAASGLMDLRANGVAQTDLILTQSEAVDGQKVLSRHFDANIATPMVVVTSEERAEAVIAELKTIDGIADAATYTGTTTRPGSPAGPAKVIDGKVLVNATLTAEEADSGEATAAVTDARERLPKIDQSVLIGGVTATALDTNLTAQRDLVKIIPIVLGVILIILIALLRSVVAPLILIASVVISYAAALGVSALVFNHIFGFPGADASVPLFGFIFLVALGVDYNIFLMTRVREEAERVGTQAGIVRGLGKTGGVITSAGVVLAATFAALGIIPILFLAQLAFIVAFGVLLDTIIVRSLLVPALSHDIGRVIWWPSKLWHHGRQ
jgi:putative drug exporter of the RND superfamily